ncbi:GntR family transcriptional regulator [Embleya hyalina]|nr:GntR family transcriptional regulator [Embleya hyalina]
MQVATHLRDRIHSGELRPGDPLPSDRDLSEQWKISRVTAQKALVYLAAEDLIERRVGVGSFVKRPAPGEPAADESSPPRRVFLGYAFDGASSSHVIAASMAPATSSAAVAFGVEEGTPLFARRTVVLGVSGPVALVTTWCRETDADTIPELAKRTPLPVPIQDLIAVDGPAGRQVRETTDARGATPAEAAGLNIPPATPVLTGHLVHTSREGATVVFIEHVTTNTVTISYALARNASPPART